MRSSRERYFRELLEGGRNGLADRLLLTLLRALTPIYALVMRLRSLAYQSGACSSRRLPRPVISVGNLTLGGTGKTPMVAWLARHFIAHGGRVAVLSRGYGGSANGELKLVADGTSLLLSPAEAGDEPYLLASSIPGLIVAIGADRYSAGLLALEKCDPDIFILDDGFQHLALQRDLNLLLLDCRNPLANGWLLPGGLLREPLSAVARADLLIFSRCAAELQTPAAVGDIQACRTRHLLTGVKRPGSAELLPFNSLPHGSGLAFAGIADPAAFFSALTAAGLDIGATLPFPDHAVYGAEELAAIGRLREESGAAYLITTEKDGVKLAAARESLGEFYMATLELSFEDAGPLLERLAELLSERG